MEHREPSERYAAIAHELIATDDALAHIRDSAVDIAFLASDKEKTSRRKTVYAECERVPDKFRWAIPHEFTITVFEPNVELFDDDQLRILMLHELLHVGIERDGNEESYYVVPHDIEEFDEIMNRYGARWAE